MRPEARLGRAEEHEARAAGQLVRVEMQRAEAGEAVALGAVGDPGKLGRLWHLVS